jgi:hypothetical protein
VRQEFECVAANHTAAAPSNTVLTISPNRISAAELSKAVRTGRPGQKPVAIHGKNQNGKAAARTPHTTAPGVSRSQ